MEKAVATKETKETVPRLIGEGSYGCVYRPSLACSNNVNVKNKLSKLMVTENAKEELQEYKNISEIDTNSQFYLGKPQICIPKKCGPNNKSVDACELYKKNSKMGRKFSLLILKDGGKELVEYSTTRLKHMHPNTNEPMRIIRDFWKESLRLFKGVILFKANGLTHHDLKPQNIVYDEAKNRLNFIDFGFMRKMKDVIESCRTDKYYIADYAFWSYPFEFAYLNVDAYMKVARLSTGEKTNYFETILKTLRSNNESKISISMRLYFDYITRNMTSENKNATIEKYLEDFKNMIMYELVPDNYMNFVKKSVETIDVFGIGMSMQFVLNYCHEFISENIYLDLEDCFYNMMTPSVLNRYTAEDALQKMQTILKKHNWYTGKTVNLAKHTKKSQSKIRYSDLFINNKTRDRLVKIQDDIKEKHSKYSSKPNSKSKTRRKFYPQ